MSSDGSMVRQMIGAAFRMASNPILYGEEDDLSTEWFQLGPSLCVQSFNRSNRSLVQHLLVSAVQAWKAGPSFVSSSTQGITRQPTKLVHILKHKYYPQNMNLNNLRGTDAAAVEALRASRMFEIYLVMLKKSVVQHHIDNYLVLQEQRLQSSLENAEEVDHSTAGVQEPHQVSAIKWVDCGIDGEAEAEVEMPDNWPGIPDKNELLVGHSALFNHDDIPKLEHVDDSEGRRVCYEVYHRTVVVFWPRSYTPTIIAGSSTKAATRTVIKMFIRGDLRSAIALLRRTVNFVTQYVRRSSTTCIKTVSDVETPHEKHMQVEPVGESIAHLLEAASLLETFDKTYFKKVLNLLANEGISSKSTLVAILRAGAVLGIWGIKRDRYEIEHDVIVKDMLQDVAEVEETDNFSDFNGHIWGGRSDGTNSGNLGPTGTTAKTFYRSISDAVHSTRRAELGNCAKLAFAIVLRCLPVLTGVENDVPNEDDDTQGRGNSGNGNTSTIGATGDNNTDEIQKFAQSIAIKCGEKLFEKITEEGDNGLIRDVLSGYGEDTVCSFIYMISFFKGCYSQRRSLHRLCLNEDYDEADAVSVPDIPYVMKVLRGVWYILTEGKGKIGHSRESNGSSVDHEGGTQQERREKMPNVLDPNYIDPIELNFIELSSSLVLRVKLMVVEMDLELTRLDREMGLHSHDPDKLQDIASRRGDLSQGLPKRLISKLWFFVIDVLCMDIYGCLPRTTERNRGTELSKNTMIGPAYRRFENDLGRELAHELVHATLLEIAVELLWKTDKLCSEYPFIYRLDGLRKIARQKVITQIRAIFRHHNQGLDPFWEDQNGRNSTKRINHDPVHRSSPVGRKTPNLLSSAGQASVPAASTMGSRFPTPPPLSPPPPSPTEHILYPVWLLHRHEAKEVPGHPDVTAYLRYGNDNKFIVNFATVQEAKNFAAMFRAENIKVKSRGPKNICALAVAKLLRQREALVRFQDAEDHNDSEGSNQNNEFDNDNFSIASGNDSDDNDDGNADDEADADDEEGGGQGEGDNEGDGNGHGEDGAVSREEKGWGLVYADVFRRPDSSAYVILEKSIQRCVLDQTTRMSVDCQRLGEEALYLQVKFGITDIEIMEEIEI